MVVSSKKYVEITCATCGKKAMKRSDFVANVLKEKRKLVCSRACAVPHRKPSEYKDIHIDEYKHKNKTGVCKLCGNEYPIAEFIKNIEGKHKKFRRSWFCRRCLVIRKREYMLKQKYKMKSIDDYHQMLEAQKNLCAICEKEMVRPCVDHNHTTGKVRKLLCVQCNAMIGNAYENTNVLFKAIEYLNDND